MLESASLKPLQSAESLEKLIDLLPKNVSENDFNVEALEVLDMKLQDVEAELKTLHE